MLKVAFQPQSGTLSYDLLAIVKERDIDNLSSQLVSALCTTLIANIPSVSWVNIRDTFLTVPSGL